MAGIAMFGKDGANITIEIDRFSPKTNVGNKNQLDGNGSEKEHAPTEQVTVRKAIAELGGKHLFSPTRTEGMNDRWDKNLWK
jgi:hypothetical protein